jgi:hypothetical protein
VCRKKGEFRVGDVAASMDPFGSVSIGQLVRIIAPAQNDPNPQVPHKWEVESMDRSEDGTKIKKIVRVTRLMRVRPALWDQWNTPVSAIDDIAIAAVRTLE